MSLAPLPGCHVPPPIMAHGIQGAVAMAVLGVGRQRWDSPTTGWAARVAGVVEPRDYAIFQKHGYMGLYAGLGAQQIHARKRLKKGKQILDHMGS